MNDKILQNVALSPDGNVLIYLQIRLLCTTMRRRRAYNGLGTLI